MLRLLGVLVLVWLVVAAVGAAVAGLFRLAVGGLALVVVTGLVGWGKRDTRV